LRVAAAVLITDEGLEKAMKRRGVDGGNWGATKPGRGALVQLPG